MSKPLVPPYMLGDEVETFSFYNHGRAAGPSTHGTVIALGPVRIRTKGGEEQGLEEETYVTKAVPRPTFNLAARLGEFKEAAHWLGVTRQAKDTATADFDRASIALQKLREDFLANSPTPCPHPADLQEGEMCLVCGIWLSDPF